MAKQGSTEQIVALHFPRGGIDRSQSFDRQPIRPSGDTGYSHTTVYGCNVLTYEPGTLRARGGSRPGLAKFSMNVVNSTNHIQDLNYIVETGLVSGGTGGVPGWGTPTTTIYGRRNGSLIKSNGGPYVWSYSIISDNCCPTLAAISNAVITIKGYTTDAGTGGATAAVEEFKWSVINDGFLVADGVIPGTPVGATISTAEDGTYFYVLWANETGGTYGALRITTAGVVDQSEAALGSGLTPQANPSTSVIAAGVIYTSFKGVGIIRTNAAALTFTNVLVSNTDLATAAGTGWQMDGGLEIPNTLAVPTGQISLAGARIAVLMRSILPTNPTAAQRQNANRFKVLLVNSTTGAIPAQTVAIGDTGGSTKNFASLTTDDTNFYVLLGNTDPTLPTTNNFAVKLNGTTAANMWTSADFNQSSSSIVYVSGETKVMVSGPALSVALNVSTGVVSAGGMGSQILAAYDAGLVETLSNNQVDEGDAANASNFNRALVVVAAAGGTLKVHYQSTWQPTISDGGVIASNAIVVRSTINGRAIYYTDGVNYSKYDAVTNKHKAWTATAGSMPTDGAQKIAKLICTWRGRIVLAGFPVEFGKWHMSAQLEPTNFDVAPATRTATQAVSSQNSDLGQVADTITCLIPYTDDVLIFGGNSSIWQLSGDPLDGGRLDRVSEGLGMAFGQSWCTDPIGNIFFCGNAGGIYTMVPGQAPVRISNGIDDFLSQIDMDQVLIRMAWEPRWLGVLVTVTHVDSAQPETHYFWESKTNSWWLVKFGNEDHNPLCLLAFQGPTATSRAILIGSWDGYVRQLSENASTDDGTDIESEVYLGPYLTPNLDDVMLKEMVVVLADNSGPVTYSIKVGDTAETAFNSTAVDTGTLVAGRNWNKYIRRAGHAVYCRLATRSPWAMESIALVTETQGTVRRRGK